MNQTTPLTDQNMYAVVGRSYWHTLLTHFACSARLSEYLQSLPTRDVELTFLLYAALRHAKSAPFGQRYLWPAFLQLAYEFELPVPLLDELVSEGVCAALTAIPDFGKGHKPNLEVVVRECKERLVHRRSPPQPADEVDAPSPSGPESLDAVKAYLNSLKNA